MAKLSDTHTGNAVGNGSHGTTSGVTTGQLPTYKHGCKLQGNICRLSTLELIRDNMLARHSNECRQRS